MDFQSSIVACLLCCHGCAIYWWGEIARNHDRDSLYSCVTYFALTVGIYTFIGGFRAVVLTDTIQGTVMILGTIVLLVGVVYHLGGVESAVNKLTEIDPSLISPYGPNEDA